MFDRVAFIGCGNMGGALAECAAKGLSKKGRGELMLSDADREKAERLAEKLSCRTVTNKEAAENADLLFIAVKPQMLAGLMEEISPVLIRTKPLIVSPVAGISAARVSELSGGAPVIRIMPNTAVSVGRGMIEYCAHGASAEQVAAFTGLMASAGALDELPEKLIDAASSVSGCGPAFLCLALEGMADGGVALGLPRDKALRYAAQTMAGLGELALQTGLHPGVLKDQVTSPGGTTIQGVRALENFGVRAAFMEAVIAAFEKTGSLKEGV